MLEDWGVEPLKEKKEPKCDNCGKKFDHWTLMDRHVKNGLCRYPDPIQCDNCGKEYRGNNRVGNLDKHVASRVCFN